MTNGKNAPRNIALFYAIIGSLWIVFSDRLVGAFFHDPRSIILASQLKGWFYVWVTALLLFLLARHFLGRLLRSEAALKLRTSALEASHRQNAELMDSIDGIVWELDVESFRFTFVSGKAEKLLGFPVEQWLNVADFWTSHIHPEDRAWAVDYCLRATREKRDHTFEYRFLAADGRAVWLRDIVTVIVENDKPVKLRGVMVDITEMKLAEAALRENEQLLSTVLDTLPVGVWIADRSGRLIRSNPAGVEIWGGAEMVGIDGYAEYKGWWPLSGEPIKAEEWGMARAIRRGETSLNEVIEIESFDGRCKTILHSAVPFFDERRQVAGAVVVNQDISEMRRAERDIRLLNAELEMRVEQRTAELAAANRELESFSYSVSHDLQAPLRHIQGFGQVLLEDFAGRLGETGELYLQRIVAATRHMGELIDDLLQLASVSRSELRRQRFDLSELVRAIAADLQLSATGREVSFSIAGGVEVNADPALLRVVMENLLGNAWKYTGTRQRAEIEFGRTQEPRPACYVRDNGVGFDMAYAGKLFSPFQRLHSREEFEGTGIGLATVKRIVERHGGTIWADSTVDGGATFYFTLEGGG